MCSMESDSHLNCAHTCSSVQTSTAADVGSFVDGSIGVSSFWSFYAKLNNVCMLSEEKEVGRVKEAAGKDGEN